MILRSQKSITILNAYKKYFRKLARESFKLSEPMIFYLQVSLDNYFFKQRFVSA